MDPSQQVPLSLAKPADACSPLENDVSGKVVLVRRGGCTFVKKAEEIMNAGGRAMVVGSSHPYLIRMVSFLLRCLFVLLIFHWISYLCLSFGVY